MTPPPQPPVLCCSVRNRSRQNAEVPVSWTELLFKKLQGELFSVSKKVIPGQCPVPNSNQVLLHFTSISCSCNVGIKGRFFYPQHEGAEIHSLLFLQQVPSPNLYFIWSPGKMGMQPGEERGSLHVLRVVLQARDEVLDRVTLVADLVDGCK